MRKKQGITLVALIITIVMLLILVTVTISSITNEGIMEKAERARLNDIVAKIKENIELIEMEDFILKNSNGQRAIFDNTKIVPKEYQDIFAVTSDGTLLYIGNDAKTQEILEGMNITTDTLLNNIKKLQNLAEEYKAENEVTDTTTQLCLQYIRRNRYNDGLWTIAAGPINTGFVTYVQQQDEELSKYTFEWSSILNSKVDFAHMCATLNAYITKSILIPYEYCGWAGDLSTIIGQIIDKYPNASSVDDSVLIAYAEQLIGTETLSSTFDLQDIIADVDAENFYNMGVDNFYETILNYYYKDNTNILNRYSIFKQNFGGPINTKTTQVLKYIYVNQLLEDSHKKVYTTSTSSRFHSIVATAFHNYFE